MKLSLEQRQQILSDGYTIIPGAIPRVMVEQALNAINADLGEGIDPEQVPIYRSRSFCPALQSSPVITDLFNKTPVLPLVESLLGEGQVRPVGGGQLAIRFPRIGDPPDRLGCHLDGMYSKLNGVKEGSISNFTMLAVVLLSDLTGPWQGNFTVWPGSHLKFEAWFREHGPESLLDGMPAIDYAEPRQLTGQAGDVVLCHYQVAHAAGPNVSPHVRYAAIFRVHHLEHGSHRPEAMTNLWLEWPGIRELAEARA